MSKPKIDGRHADIMPLDGSHYVMVDGQPWSRHDSLAVAEWVRDSIVQRWAAEYNRRAADVEMAHQESHVVAPPEEPAPKPLKAAPRKKA